MHKRCFLSTVTPHHQEGKEEAMKGRKKTHPEWQSDICQGLSGLPAAAAAAALVSKATTVRLRAEAPLLHVDILAT